MKNKNKIVTMAALLVALATGAWATVEFYAAQGNMMVVYNSTYHFFNPTTELQDNNSWDDDAYVPQGTTLWLPDDAIEVWHNTSSGYQKFKEGYEYTMIDSYEV